METFEDNIIKKDALGYYTLTIKFEEDNGAFRFFVTKERIFDIPEFTEIEILQ